MNDQPLSGEAEVALPTGSEQPEPTFDLGIYFQNILTALDNLSPYVNDVAEPNEFKVRYAVSGNVMIVK